MPMKLILFLFTVLVLRVYGQVNCSFTINPTYSFFTNGVVNYTNSINLNQSVYLCGNKTTVYDTLPLFQSVCREVYLESNTIYYIKGSCPSASAIFARANSTVVILPGSGLTSVLHEPGVVIVNSASVIVLSYTCAVLNFGTSECSTTGVKLYEAGNAIKVFPNPVSDLLVVAVTGMYAYNITNLSGQRVLEEEFRTSKDSFEINTENLAPGLYFLHLTTQAGVITKKFVKENR